MGPMGVVTVYRARYIFAATNACRKKGKRSPMDDCRSKRVENFIWTARKTLGLFSENYKVNDVVLGINGICF